MDIYEKNGLSWADQWDPQLVPSEMPDKEKGDSQKSKNKLLKWVKSLCKKSKSGSQKA